MNRPFVDREICGYCGACVSVCPTNAVELVDIYLRIDPDRCIGCLACLKVCPLGAMKLNSEYMKYEASEIPELDPYRNPDVKRLDFDVLVIGAGPAGSIAARTVAQENLEVLLIEKRQEIGAPVRCAEGVSKKALVKIVDPDPKWISANINGCRLYSPDKAYIKVDDPGSGFVLERKIFDRELAAQAAKAGAQVWVKSRAINLIKDIDNRVTGAIVRRQDGDYAIRAKIVIAADGVESQVGKWAGIDTTCKNSEVDTGVQYLITGINSDNPAFHPEYCDFYLGREVAPRGYAWVFPKGDNTANVGLGIGGHISEARAIDYLNKFVKEGFPEASVLAMIAGCVPVSGALSELVRDGFMIIGDAAHQNDPLSGGGIINSMISGQIAGEVASQALRNGDISSEELSEYEKRWYSEIGRTFWHLRKLREGVLRFSDKTFNDLARVLAHKNPSRMSIIDMFWTALKDEPKLLLELRHLIAIGWFQ